jgi:transposase
MVEKKRRRNAKPGASMAVVRAVFYDVHYTDLSLSAIARKHSLSSAAVISKWLKKYSSDFAPMQTIPTPEGNLCAPGPAAVNPREKELDKALQEARMKIICLETMIDLAEKELNVAIRKNSGTKQ